MFGEYEKKVVFDNTECVKFDINPCRARMRVHWLDQAKSVVAVRKRWPGADELDRSHAKDDVAVTGRLKCCVGGLAGRQFGFPNIIRKQKV